MGYFVEKAKRRNCHCQAPTKQSSIRYSIIIRSFHSQGRRYSRAYNHSMLSMINGTKTSLGCVQRRAERRLQRKFGWKEVYVHIKFLSWLKDTHAKVDVPPYVPHSAGHPVSHLSCKDRSLAESLQVENAAGHPKQRCDLDKNRNQRLL